jgi:hypothetical protein
MDSPTRRSSIPVLKQTNKTKSFQSYVNLNLNDDTAKSESSSSPCTSPSTSSRDHLKFMINVPSLKNSNTDIDNVDINTTKLCEENKKLRDQQQNLILKYEEGKLNSLQSVFRNINTSPTHVFQNQKN